jgi:hypothetical protein
LNSTAQKTTKISNNWMLPCQERQFFAQIRDDDGKAYWLPAGSYAIQNTDMALKAAHDAAVGAAGESGFEFSVVVTVSMSANGRIWLRSKKRTRSRQFYVTWT